MLHLYWKQVWKCVAKKKDQNQLPDDLDAASLCFLLAVVAQMRLAMIIQGILVT